ncbi:MAG: M67 family metallopeptidase [Acidimicrobiales bacterium]
MSDSEPAPPPLARPTREPSAPGTPSLHMARSHLDRIVAHCLAARPAEGCGLLTGDPDASTVVAVHPTTNLAESARLYTVDPREHLLIDRTAEANGWAVIGVFHSHTHTDAYPSATDIAQAPDPSWHYVVVSLRNEEASVRSFQIVEGLVTEEEIEAAGN